jgi:hypothetical protein
VIVLEVDPELLEVVVARGLSRRLTGRLHRRQEQADERADDRDDSEQLDQREPGRGSLGLRRQPLERHPHGRISDDARR